jgi:hypothetical protein
LFLLNGQGNPAIAPDSTGAARTNTMACQLPRKDNDKTLAGGQ